MRHPTTHSFLKWFGPTLVLSIGGSIGLVAALAQPYAGVKDWGQKQFDRWWPIVSAPSFLFALAIIIAAYIWALVWTGTPRMYKYDIGKLNEGLGSALLGPARPKPAVDRNAATAARIKALLGPDFETLDDRVARQKSEKAEAARQAIITDAERLISTPPVATWWPLHQALNYLVYASNWADTQVEASNRNDFDKRVMVEFLERLARGDIEARGKLGWATESRDRATENINADFWVTAFIRPFGEIVLASPDTQGTAGSNGTSDVCYQGIIVRKEQVEAAWPPRTGSSTELTALARMVEPLRAQIAKKRSDVGN